MANECAPGECENDPKYTTPVKLKPYPGGSEGGHEFVTELPETGTAGVEYIVLTDITDCDSFEGSWAWNTEAECWVQTSGSGGGGGGATYSFEETDTGWRAKKNGTVIFTYVDKDTIDEYKETAKGFEILRNGSVIFTHDDKGAEYTAKNFVDEETGKKGWQLFKDDTPIYTHYCTEPIQYVFETTDTGWRVKENGTVKFSYTDVDTKYSIEATDDGWVFKEDGTTKFTYTEPLDTPSDGTYYMTGSLAETIKGSTVVPAANIAGLVLADVVLNETLVFDSTGTVGRVTAVDTTNNRVTVETITTSPGERRGTRLGAVDDNTDLPTTVAAALALGWQTPLMGDFAYVREDSDYDNKLTEYVIQGVDAAGNITWAYSHTLNAGNYITGVNYSDGTAIPVNADGTVTLPADKDTKYFFEDLKDTDGNITGWRVREGSATGTIVYTYNDNDTTYTFAQLADGFQATSSKGSRFIYTEKIHASDVAVNGQAVSYFVDADNGDDVNNNGTTVDTPFRTIQKAINQLPPKSQRSADYPGIWYGAAIYIHTKATKHYEPIYMEETCPVTISSYDAARSSYDSDTGLNTIWNDSKEAMLTIDSSAYAHPTSAIAGRTIRTNAVYIRGVDGVYFRLAGMTVNQNAVATAVWVGNNSNVEWGEGTWASVDGVKFTWTVNANTIGECHDTKLNNATGSFEAYDTTGTGCEGIGVHGNSSLTIYGYASKGSVLTVTASNWGIAASWNSSIFSQCLFHINGGYNTNGNYGGVYANRASTIVFDENGFSAASGNSNRSYVYSRGKSQAVSSSDRACIRMTNSYVQKHFEQTRTDCVGDVLQASNGGELVLSAQNAAYLQIICRSNNRYGVRANSHGTVGLGIPSSGTANITGTTSTSTGNGALAAGEGGDIAVWGGSGTTLPKLTGRYGMNAYTGGKITYPNLGSFSGTTQRVAATGGRIYTGNQSSIGNY